MNRKEIIKELEKIKTAIAEDADDVTDYAREHAYFDIVDAIEKLQENEEK